MKTLTHIFCILLIAGHSSAQSTANYFFNLTTEEGLTHNNVFDIIQDQYGFIWIATVNGLNRYDGYTFTPFHHDPEDPLSLSSNEISKLYEDSQGRLWIGTMNSCLNLYDPASSHFTRYPFPGMENISDIRERKDGMLLVATMNNGLFVFDPDHPEKYERIWPNDENGESSINRFLPGQEEEWWIGGRTGMTIQPSTSTGESFAQQFSELIHPAVPDQYYISSLYKTQKGQMWIGTDKGLFVWDSLKLHRLLLSQKLREDGIQNLQPNINHVLEMVEDGEGNRWLGTPSGLILLNTQKDQYTLFQPDRTSRHSLTGFRCNALWMDKNGMLWIGTDKGISTLHPNALKFDRGNGRKLLLPRTSSTSIREIVKVGDRYFISSESEGGLYVANQENWHVRFDPLQSGNFTALYLDQKNTLYAGTIRLDDFYIITTDPLSIKPVKKTRDDQDRQRLRGAAIMDFEEDSQGKVWIAALGCLNRYDPESGVFDRIKDVKDLSVNLANVNDLHLDRDDNLWIATNTGLALLPAAELEKFPETQLSFKSAVAEAGNKQSLSINIVHRIFESADGVIWLGTNAGLHQAAFDGNNLQIKRHYLRKEGPEPSIVGILEDDSANLWISTSSVGLFRYSPHSAHAWNFTARDGLLSNSFQTNHLVFENAFKEPDGKMVFINEKTLISFYPKEIQKNSQAPLIYLTDLKLSNKQETIQKEEFLFRPILDDEQLIVCPDQRMIQIQFAALNFLNPEKTTYAYRLQGFRDSLIYLDNRRNITFINLPPRTYNLEIVAWNSDGVQTKKPLVLSMVVKPRIYETYTAFVFYTLLVGGFIYGILQFQWKKKDARRLEKLNELKNRFITNITHELKTPLTIIIGQASQILQKSTRLSRQEIYQKTQVVSKQGEQLRRLVQQLLDLRELDVGLKLVKNENGDIVAFLRNQVILHHSLAESKKVKIYFEASPQELTAAFDPKLLSSAFNNLLTNAVKFTSEGGWVGIIVEKTSRKGSGELKISVQDTGIGIALDELELIFDVFYRCETAEQMQIQGTGIGLALVRQIVNKLEGRIKVDSILGEGSTFTIFLPLQPAAGVSTEIPSQHEQTIAPISKNDLGAPSEKPLVLIIEDHPGMQQYLADCLEDHYNTKGALNGDQGIALARELNPDLIICDVMMPGKSGTEVCRLLKEHEDTKHIPVIMLTAKADLLSEKEGIRSGADLYLGKPFDEEQLLLWMHNQLQKSQELQKVFTTTSWVARSMVSTDHLAGDDRRLLEDILTFIRKNIKDPKLSVPDLALAVNRGERSLQRDFQRLTGQTARSFITNLRMNLAKEMLLSTNLTVEQIALEVGYTSIFSFSRAFKNWGGLAPNHYRNKEK